MHTARKREIAADLLNLTVLHPAGEDERQVAAFVARWLRDEALRQLLPQVAEYAARVTSTLPDRQAVERPVGMGKLQSEGRDPAQLATGATAADLALYIVAHEVAHLVELNHSARFWSLVDGLFPGSAEAR